MIIPLNEYLAQLRGKFISKLIASPGIETRVLDLGVVYFTNILASMEAAAVAEGVRGHLEAIVGGHDDPVAEAEAALALLPEVPQ